MLIFNMKSYKIALQGLKVIQNNRRTEGKNMKKKISIVCVLLVMTVLLVVAYNYIQTSFLDTTSTEAKESNKLNFKEKGTYVKSAFGEEFIIYRFGEPNSAIVVFETIDGIYLVAEYSGEKGTSYGNIFMPDRKFIALSNEYFLFETEEGKIAVSIEKRKNVKNGESFYNEYLFEELSDEERQAFIYPVESIHVEK